MIREHDQIFRLYCHEAQRVFHDRLINKADKRYFYGILSEMSSKHFSKVSEHEACREQLQQREGSEANIHVQLDMEKHG